MYQNYIIVHDRYIFLDGYSSEYLELNKNDKKKIAIKYSISLLVNPQLSTKDVDINNLTIKDPVADVNWEYGDKYYKCKINLNTCRPYYNSKDGMWIDSHENFYETKKILSCNKYFGEYVFDNGKYPTKYEFLVYIYDRENGRGNSTLMTNIMPAIDIHFEEYKECMEKLSPIEFGKRFKMSVSRLKRIEMENEMEN